MSFNKEQLALARRLLATHAGAANFGEAGAAAHAIVLFVKDLVDAQTAWEAKVAAENEALATATRLEQEGRAAVRRANDELLARVQGPIVAKLRAATKHLTDAEPGWPWATS